jgi:septal ring factor EnvC (AmiA/AmiB activator)
MGSADDRARLDQLNQEGAVLSGEIESIEAAIAEIRARIADAKTAAALDADRQKRQGVVRLANELKRWSGLPVNSNSSATISS